MKGTIERERQCGDKRMWVRGREGSKGSEGRDGMEEGRISASLQMASLLHFSTTRRPRAIATAIGFAAARRANSLVGAMCWLHAAHTHIEWNCAAVGLMGAIVAGRIATAVWAHKCARWRDWLSLEL